MTTTADRSAVPPWRGPLQRKTAKSVKHYQNPCLKILLLTILLTVTGCTKHFKPQVLRLDNNTTITLKDAWVLEHAPYLLQAVLVYDGADPNDTYNLRAALRKTADGPDGGSSWIKQYPTVSPNNKNQIEVIWEFMSFPKDSEKIYLRLYYHGKQPGQQSGKLEFVLPGFEELPHRKM